MGQKCTRSSKGLIDQDEIQKKARKKSQKEPVRMASFRDSKYSDID